MPLKINPESGSSLVAVLIGSSVIAIIIMFLMQTMKDLNDSTATVKIQMSVQNANHSILAILKERTGCEANFKGLSTAAAAPDNLTSIVGSLGPPVTVIMQEGQLLNGGTHVVQNIVLRNFQPYSVAAPDNLRGTMEVAVYYATVGGGLMRMRRIILSVELNSFPPVAAGPADAIKTCIAIGSESSDVWRLAGSGDIYFNTANVGVGTLNPAEKLEVAANVMAIDYFHPSDHRLKRNIEPAQELAKIEKLNGVHFQWISNSRGAYGLIAQEVESLFPEMVHTNPESGLKSVDYDQIVGPLIESVKTLAARNRSLQTKIDRVKEELSRR